MKRNSLRLISMFAATGIAASAMASNITTNMAVTANVSDSCSTVTANTISFGAYNPLSKAAVDKNGNIGVTCTNGTPFTVDLNAGSGKNASYAERKLTGPKGAVINYNLYSDSSHSTVWGDGKGKSGVVNGTGTGSVVNETVYGQIPAGQSGAVAGDYTDTVTVAVNY